MIRYFRPHLGRFLSLLCAAGLLCASSESALAETVFLPLVQGAQAASADQAVVAAASASATAVVQLAPGVDPDQLAADYQATVTASIPALSFYCLQGASPDLLTRLAGDARVVFAQDDELNAGFEARQRTFDAAGSDFDYLQRYFGFGSGDSDGEDSDADFEVDKAAKKPKKGNAKKGNLKATEQVLIVNGQKLDDKWQTWGRRDIRLDNALKHATGAGVTVAVLDTGVDLNHPLLASRLLPGFDFVENDSVPNDSPNGIDDDEDGQIDEGVGHGTHVSGIIAAVAPNAKMLPVRVLNSDGGGELFDILQGIDFAVAHGARVINFSLSADEDSPLLATAIQYAQAHGLVIVAASAGEADYLEYPAAYDGVIAVGAIKKDHRITDFSTSYAELVDVFAPGELIFSTYTGGAFAWWSGTSMAAPFVSGEAALLIEKEGADACAPGCINDMITGEVDSVKPKLKGNGRINIEKAVNKAVEAAAKAAEAMKKAAEAAAKAAKEAVEAAAKAAEIAEKAKAEAAKTAEEAKKAAGEAAKDPAKAAEAAKKAVEAAAAEVVAAATAQAAQDAAKAAQDAAKAAAEGELKAAQDAAQAAQDAAKAAQDAVKQ